MLKSLNTKIFLTIKLLLNIEKENRYILVRLLYF